jgi:hypothetical protein
MVCEKYVTENTSGVAGATKNVWKKATGKGHLEFYRCSYNQAERKCQQGWRITAPKFKSSSGRKMKEHKDLTDMYGVPYMEEICPSPDSAMRKFLKYQKENYSTSNEHYSWDWWKYGARTYTFVED